MTFQIDLSKVDTSYWRDHPNIIKSDSLWPGYHCNLDKDLRRDYGITCRDYYEIYDRQQGRCAICGCEQAQRFDIDHDHRTKKIRGLLCKRCNRNLSDAVAYYILQPPAEDLNLIISTKKVIARDKRLKNMRKRTKAARARQNPQPLAPVDKSSSAEEKYLRALESSR